MNYTEREERQIQEFIDKDRQFLWARAMGLTHKVEDAEDLFQDTVMKIFQGWTRFDPETNFRAWAARIMLNTHINNSTRRKDNLSMDFHSGLADHIVTLSPDDMQHEHNYSDSPEKIFFFNHIDENLMQTLYSLPDQFRVPFALYHFEGYMYEDISKILSLPIGTVKSRIFRARKMMKERVEETRIAH